MNAYDTKLQHVLDEIRELLCERDGSPEFDSASECEEVDEVCGLRREELDEVCELPREHGGVPKFGSASECEEYIPGGLRIHRTTTRAVFFFCVNFLRVFRTLSRTQHHSSTSNNVRAVHRFKPFPWVPATFINRAWRSWCTCQWSWYISFPRGAARTPLHLLRRSIIQ